MMEGIEILEQTEIMQDCQWMIIIAIILATISTIGIIVNFGLIIYEHLNLKAFSINMIFVVISFILSWILGGLGSTVCQQPTGKYEYKVTIDDSVYMAEFYKRYDIIKVNGKIFTIREKEE